MGESREQQVAADEEAGIHHAEALDNPAAQKVDNPLIDPEDYPVNEPELPPQRKHEDPAYFDPQRAAVLDHAEPVKADIPEGDAVSSEEAEDLAGEALDARVKELGVEGYSTMSADEKRKAVAKREGDQSSGSAKGVTR